VLGAYAFVVLPKALVVRLIGAVILAFIALRSLGLVRVEPGPLLLVCGGGVVGLLSGLVGSAGPLGAALFLALPLSPVAYIASEATTALVMHAVKAVVYQRALHIGHEVWLLAAFLGVAMILGTWAGKRFIERMPVTQFRRFVTLLLMIIALQMLLFG